MAFLLKKRGNMKGVQPAGNGVKINHDRKARLGRKADITMSIKEIIGLVLAIGAILVLLALLFVGAQILLSRPEQGTTESMKNLNSAMNTLLSIQNNAECYIPLYIDPQYVVIGFDAGDAKPIKTVGIDREIERPTECKRDPCICLCHVSAGYLGAEACKKNNGCYEYPSDKLNTLRTELDGEPASLILLGFGEGQSGVRNTLLTKNGTMIVIKKVENTMGAEPCSAIKYG